MKKLLKTREVAQILGKSPWWVRENIGNLGIPAIKIGRHWRFDEKDLESWLLLNRVA